MTKRIAVLLLTAGVVLLNADTLVLRNGNRVEGRYAGGSDHVIRFAVGSQINTYNVGDVVSLQFYGGQQSYPSNSGGYNQGSSYPQSSSYPPPAPYPPNPNYPPQNSQAQNYPQSNYPSQNYPAQGYPSQNNPANTGYPQASNYPPPPPPAPNAPASPNAPAASNAPPPANTGNLEVPAGTQVVVRMIDPVNSERDSLGQTYRASLDQPVVVNGQTVIPRGADAVATLIDAQQSGKIAGRTVLTLDLKSITVNGRPYDIVTTGVSQQSGSRGERSAKVIGGTAALGAIIGGIAGGGKGAAIGAGSGAAVGTAAEVATSGQKVKVPAETRLTFTLQNPLNL